MLTFLLWSSKRSVAKVDSFFRLILLFLGDINVNPGPNTVAHNSIPLNTQPMHNHGEPTMPSECNSLGCYKAHDNSKWKIFTKKSLHILHLNINSLLLKIDEIRFIAKQSNASIIGISGSKLESSILSSELDIDQYNLIRLDRSRRGGGVASYIKKYLSYNHNTRFFRNIETIFIDISLPKSKPILVGVLHRPPEKPDFIEHLNNSLKESNISNNQECYLIGDFNANLLSGNKMILEKQYSDSYSQAPIVKNYVDICFAHSLHQLIREQTRTTEHTKTLIDHILTNLLKKSFRVVLLKWDYLIMKLFTVQEKRHFWNWISTIKFHSGQWKITQMKLLWIN